MPTVEQLIESIKVRRTSTRWGIGLASHYVKSVEGCIYGDLFSVDDWRKAVKDAEGRLTYCDEVMSDAEAVTKSIKEGMGLPDGFRMSFDCTLTSRRLDRDGDILEPNGLAVDKQMPLLWQHLPMQPVGRHLETLSQNDDRIRVKFGIVDTPLGRDAAILTKAGCLRMSHGFKPYEFEPVEQKDDKATGSPVGWHVTKGEIREGSLVSIPANVDGIVEAYSDGELMTPLVKSWAKGYYDSRPVQVPVNIDLSVKVNGQDVMKSQDEPAAPKNLPDKETKEDQADKTTDADDSDGHAQAKSEESAPASDLDNKMVGTKELVGSFEWVRENLRKTASSFVSSRHPEIDSEGWADLVATYPDRAIVRVTAKKDNSDYLYYRANWTMSDGQPEWVGEATAVEIRPEVVVKAADPMDDLSPAEQIKLFATQACAASVQMPLEQAQVALDLAQGDLGAMADMIRTQRTDIMWE